MQRNTPVGGWAILAVAVFTLAACGTTRQAVMTPTEPVAQAESGGVSADLRYLDDLTLRRDFGSGANPFLTEYYRLSFRRILVFELTLRNHAGMPVELELSECELDYGARRTSPINRFQLAGYWEGLDEPRIAAEKKRTIDRWMLPNRAVVADGATRFGYLVFMANLPREGAAAVNVPVFYEGGSLTLSFDYTF